MPVGIREASVLASASTFEADSNDNVRNLSATPNTDCQTQCSRKTYVDEIFRPDRVLTRCMCRRSNTSPCMRLDFAICKANSTKRVMDVYSTLLGEDPYAFRHESQYAVYRKIGIQ